MANANSHLHLQKYEKKRLGCNNKTHPTTGITTIGDIVIGNLLDRNMILPPLAIEPLGHVGPIPQHILFDIEPTSSPPLTFTQTKPKNATSLYSKIMRFPSPKGVLTLANHNCHTPTTRPHSHKRMHTSYPLRYA
jgi:hypothetical protein